MEVILRIPDRKRDILMYFVFLGAFANLRKATVSFVMSVRPFALNKSSPTGRVLIKLDILGVFFRKFVEKIEVSLKSGKNNGCYT